MNYWVFDGEDIVGPLTPQELAARADFSVNTLICAENESEDQDAWRPAGTFEELKFDENGCLLSAVSVPPREQTFRAPITPSVTQTVSVPQTADEPVVIRLSKDETEPEEPEEQTVRLVQGDDIVLPLKDIPAEEKPQPEKEPAAKQDVVQKENVTPAQPAPAAPVIKKPEKAATVPPAPAPATVADEPPAAEKKIAEQPIEKPAAKPAVKQKTAEEKSSLVEEEMVASSSVQADIPALPDEIPPTVTIPVLGESLPEKTLEEVLTEPDFDEPQPINVEVEASAPAEEVTEEETADDVQEIVGETQPPAPAISAAENKEIIEDKTPVEIEPAVEKEEPVAQPSAESAPAVEEEEPVVQPPADTAPAVEQETPAPSEAIAEEEAPASEAAPVAEENTPHDPKEDTVKNIFSGSVAVEETREITEPFAMMGPQRVNHVKPHLDSTPAIEKFLHKQRDLLKPSRQKAKGMLWVLLLLIVPGIVWMAALIGEGHKKAPETIPQVAVKPPVPAEEKPAPQPVVTPPPAPKKADVPPAPVSEGDRAMAVVQNYGLSGNKGTIAAYFDKIYQQQLSEGYEAVWSAEPLHKSTYIVKYRLTKPRMEPIVYVFQVDVARKRLTGALNNIALDLVGKIQ